MLASLDRPCLQHCLPHEDVKYEIVEFPCPHCKTLQATARQMMVYIRYLKALPALPCPSPTQHSVSVIAFWCSAPKKRKPFPSDTFPVSRRLHAAHTVRTLSAVHFETRVVFSLSPWKWWYQPKTFLAQFSAGPGSALHFPFHQSTSFQLDPVQRCIYPFHQSTSFLARARTCRSTGRVSQKGCFTRASGAVFAASTV